MAELEDRVERLEGKVSEIDKTIAVFGESIKRFDKAIDKLDSTLDKIKEDQSFNVVRYIRDNWPVLILFGFLIAQHFGWIN